MRVDVTSVGDVNIDIITSKIESMPERDSQIVINDLFISSGGCAANLAKALYRLGLKTRLIGKIGNDLFGNFLVNELKGIDLKLSTGTMTGLTFAITFEDWTRSFITYPGANGELGIEDIDLELIDGRYLHIASFFLQGLRENTSELMDYSHSKGMLNSFDTGWDPAGWSENDIKLLRKILRGVDIFFPNIKEASAITKQNKKEEICENLLKLGPEIIALKMGSKGCYIASEEERIFVPAYRVGSIDTTGAGDVFNAAFIFGHYKGWDLQRVAEFSSRAAAISTTGYGSSRYPRLEEIERPL